ncbi:MAG: hypothetical protein ACRD4S_14270 [Candidatus Acidiferrales bacterium]
MSILRENAAGNGDEGRARPSHRFTKDLERAQILAVMLAKSRASAAVEVSDFLAGMYMYDWERLSKYWDDTDEIEGYLQQICRISPQRWHRWIEHYDVGRQSGEKRRSLRLREALRLPRSPKVVKSDPARVEPSLELQAVLRRAGELAPFHDTSEGRSIPILTSECVLLAIVQCSESDAGRRLFLSGLDVLTLEKEALRPRHAPRH